VILEKLWSNQVRMESYFAWMEAAAHIACLH
jgi:hypothetical protein